MNLDGFTYQNCWLSPAGELVVRPSAYTDCLASAIQASSDIAAGFSMRSPNTGEVQHYLFMRHRSTAVCTLHVLDEEFQVLTSLVLGPVPKRLVVTHAAIASAHVSSLEMVIGGPDIPTLYGFVGGGVMVAEKVDSGDPYASSIDIPRGIVAAFAGRIVIGNGKNLYISDAYGTRVTDVDVTFTGPRVYVAENIADMGAVVYGLHVVDDGALYVTTDRGVWALPPEAVAQGATVRNLFSLVSSYGATDYQQVALSSTTLYGLTDLGLAVVTRRDVPEIPLDEPRMARSIAESVRADDYRSLRVWPWERGVVVSQPHAVMQLDDRRGFRSWQTVPIPAENAIASPNDFTFGWTTSGTTVSANAATDPDGGSTADGLVGSASAGVHGLYRNFTGLSAGETYRFEVYAKAGNEDWLCLTNAALSTFAFFDLSTGVVGSSAGVTASIESAGSGWYRCIVDYTAATPSFQWYVYSAEANTDVLFSGDAVTVNTYLWGASHALYNAAAFDCTIVGVLEAADGSSIYLSPDRAWCYHGQDEDVVGVACGTVQVEPEGSVVVREVTTSSDTPANQRCAVRGSSVRVKDTPQAVPVIGTATWSATEKYGERAVRSRRHRFAVRTDDVTLEIGADVSGSRLGLIDVGVRGQGRRRP